MKISDWIRANFLPLVKKEQRVIDKIIGNSWLKTEAPFDVPFIKPFENEQEMQEIAARASQLLDNTAFKRAIDEFKLSVMESMLQSDISDSVYREEAHRIIRVLNQIPGYLQEYVETVMLQEKANESQGQFNTTGENK